MLVLSSLRRKSIKVDLRSVFPVGDIIEGAGG